MKSAIFATVAIAILAVFCFVPVMDDADAAPTCTMDLPEVSSFDTMGGGKITINVTYNSFEFDLRAVVTENTTGDVLYDKVHKVPREKSTLTLDMSGYTDSGNHTMKLELMPAEGSGAELNYNTYLFTVDVKSNPLSNWTTYAIIAIAVIAIAIVVFIRMRDPEKKKTEAPMTFEELEAQRKSEMAAKSGNKKGTQPKASSTERKKYKANKKE